MYLHKQPTNGRVGDVVYTNLHHFYLLNKNKTMKKYSIILVLILSIAGSMYFAQTSQPTVTDDFKPSTFNQPGKEYPMVNSQGYDRFRVELLKPKVLL